MTVPFPALQHLPLHCDLELQLDQNINLVHSLSHSLTLLLTDQLAHSSLTAQSVGLNEVERVFDDFGEQPEHEQVLLKLLEQFSGGGGVVDGLFGLCDLIPHPFDFALRGE